MERDSGNKIDFIDVVLIMTKLIMDNELDGLWRRENRDPSESFCYDRSSGTKPRIDRVYIDVKIASSTKIYHIMVCCTDNYNANFIDRFPLKSEIGKDSWYFNNSILCKPEFSTT